MRAGVGFRGGVLLACFLSGCAGGGDEPVRVQVDTGGVTPSTLVRVEPVDGAPTCASLGLATLETTIAPPASGTYALDAIGNSFTAAVDDGALAMDWRASMSIDAVIVSGEGRANVYRYAPFQVSGARLSAPSASDTAPAPIRSISVCYGYELRAYKTARASFTRTTRWSIEKSVEASSLVLAPGETYEMPFAVDVSPTGQTDSAHAVTGQILIGNPAPFAAEITSVVDTYLPTGATVPVDCGVSFPHFLAAGSRLECTYTMPLDQPLGGTNKVVVSTNPSGYVKGMTTIAVVDFTSATVNAVDDCVAVDDDRYGPLGTVCAGEGPVRFSYVSNIGPYTTCGPTAYVNTATFVASTSGATGSSSETVQVDVPCPTSAGCSLTQGYWKTHSSYGPAPYDDAWAALPAGADTGFFLAGASYLAVLRTTPSGNPYYTLAHQFIAAELNGLNGADLSAVSGAFAEARSLLASHTPSSTASLAADSAERGRFVALAGILDAYNNGSTGPGHCSESRLFTPAEKHASKKKRKPAKAVAAAIANAVENAGN